MKKLVLMALACISLIACQQEKNGFEIEGEITGMDSGMVYLKTFRNKMFENVDSTQVKDGKFKFKGSVDVPVLYGIATENMKYPAQLFVENKEFTVNLSADGEIIKIENSPVNDIFLTNQELVFNNGYNIDSLVSKYPNSPVAAFFLYRYFPYKLPLENLKATRAKLAPELNTLQYVIDLDKIINILENVQIGSVAPEFSLPDTAGVSVALSSFRGKYVLLDFWASWCPPCRKENPNVVAAYQQFKDKNFTIIGVSLDKDKAAWLKAIESDKLDWTQLSDLKFWDAEVAALYGIRSIPSNVLINPEGVIIAKNLEQEELHEKLKEVLK